jgi:hypothetical protein
MVLPLHPDAKQEIFHSMRTVKNNKQENSDSSMLKLKNIPKDLNLEVVLIFR